MPKLNILRHQAFILQAGRCYYCDLPMWEDNPQPIVELLGISSNQARALKCTAEHLKARCEGGKDTPQNIVAACSCCNSRRHTFTLPLSPAAYRQHVQRRMKAGKWHPDTLMQRVKDTFQNPLSHSAQETPEDALQGHPKPPQVVLAANPSGCNRLGL